MALPYTPPGVNVSEVVGRNVSAILAGPTTLCLVGRTAGAINALDQVTLQDGDADNNPLTPNAPVSVSLPGLPQDATLNAVTSVVDAFTGQVYTQGTDFTVTSGKIKRVSTGSIADGTVVRVSYSYTPEDYFAAKTLYSLQEVEQRYGSAWSADGLSIGSPVSHAAHIAFENGAPFVVVQPLFVDSGSGRVQPTPVQAASAATWQATFVALRDYEDINVVVPVVGQYDDPTNTADVSSGTVLSIFNAVQAYVWYMRTQDQYVFAVLGEDATTDGSVNSTTLVNHASALQAQFGGDVAEQLALISPAKFIRATAASNQTMYVGGQYAAAAVGGQLAGRRVQVPLTRKPLAGFTQVGERRTKEEKNVEAANGILVVEQRGAAVQIRHGLTLNNSSVQAREINVVRAKHFMVESLYNTFDSQIIGEVVADNTAPAIVRSAVVATLERLKSLEVLAAYRSVDARLLVGDPTYVEVRFSYSPFFPLNYVDIVFSIDLANQTITNVLPGAGT
jgi:hypothetical protein